MQRCSGQIDRQGNSQMGRCNHRGVEGEAGFGDATNSGSRSCRSLLLVPFQSSNVTCRPHILSEEDMRYPSGEPVLAEISGA